MIRVLLLNFLLSVYFPLYSITTTGEWIPLEGGLNAYPACISLGVLDNNEHQINIVNILIVSNEAQQIKENNTKALFRLNDGSILELNSLGEATSVYDPKVHYGNLYNLFQSWQSYVIKDADLNKLLSQPIIKVRVEQRSGDRKDVEISKKQGKKVMNKLNESWNSVIKKQEQRIQNKNTDLKEDF